MGPRAGKVRISFFVKRPIKPVGKIFRTQKTDCQNLISSRSYKSLKFEFVDILYSRLFELCSGCGYESVQRLWQLQGQCIVNISDTGGSFSVFRLGSGNGGITSGTP